MTVFIDVEIPGHLLKNQALAFALAFCTESNLLGLCEHNVTLLVFINVALMNQFVTNSFEEV